MPLYPPPELRGPTVTDPVDWPPPDDLDPPDDWLPPDFCPPLPPEDLDPPELLELPDLVPPPPFFLSKREPFWARAPAINARQARKSNARVSFIYEFLHGY